MGTDRVGLFEGWKLVGMATLTLLLFVGVLALIAGDDDGIRLAIRATARTSIVLFLMAFTASSLKALLPGPLTTWQLRNRRYLGVSFAVSHFIHAAAIAALFQADRPLFWTLTNAGNIASGSLAYLFIVLMAATSFDRAVAWIGPKRWQILHKVGAWFIWASFVVTFGKRIPGSDFYWIPMAALLLALGLRVAAWRSRRGRLPSPV